MKTYKLLIIFLLFHVCNNSFSQTLSSEEKRLYDLIMQYRAEKGLPDIQLSKSLTFVAQTHVNDLQTSEVVTSGCNMHSWSNNGRWTPCCYTPDHAQASCMWNKPRELTGYPGYGFEISYGSYGAMVTPEGALQGWKSSYGHNEVVINQGVWANYDWKAIGIGISKSYAVVWFGKELDGD